MEPDELQRLEKNAESLDNETGPPGLTATIEIDEEMVRRVVREEIERARRQDEAAINRQRSDTV